MKKFTRFVLILFVLSLFAGPVAPTQAGVRQPETQAGDTPDLPDGRQSPAAPSEFRIGSDLRFVANDYTNGDLDQYLFRTNVADGKLRYNIPITRFFFNDEDAAITFNSSGFLTSTALARIRTKRLLPEYARLQMRVFDVDEDAAWCPEVDTIEVNGTALYQGSARARLSGADDTWSVVSYDVPISMLKFPRDKGNRAAPTPALNEIAIRIDSRNCTASSGDPAWAVEVDWGSLDFERSAANIIRPVLFAHGWTGNTSTFDPVENRLREDGLPSAGQADLLEGLYPISETANLLQDYIYWGMLEYGVDKVNIFAHSKGGLVSRRALEDYDAYAHTQNLLTWDTPNHGTYWADRTWSVETACAFKYPFDSTRRNRCISVAEEFRTDRVRNDFNYSGCTQNTDGTWNNCRPKYVKNRGVNYYSFAAHGGLLTLVDVVSPSVSATYPWDAYAAGEYPMATSMHVDGDFATDHGGILSDQSAYRCAVHLLDSSRYSCPTTLAANSVAETDDTTPPNLLLNELGNLNNNSTSHPVDVDGGSTLMFAVEADAALTFILRDPSNRLINPAVADSDPNITYASGISEGLNIYEYVITNPPTGTWTPQASSTGAVNYAITTLSNSIKTLNLMAEQRTYHSGELVQVVAGLVSGGTPLTGSTYTGQVEFPSGGSQALSFNDAGINGDSSAGDGLYTAQFTAPDEKGYMLVAVEAERNLIQRSSSLALPLSPQTATIGSVSFEWTNDTDNDGFIDQLMINVGITVNQTGNFDLRGSLADPDGNRIDSVLFSSRLYGADPLTPGSYIFTLTFSGQALFEYGEPGPYWLTGLELLDTTAQDLLVDAKTNYYQTAAYSLNQFEQPLATIQSASELASDLDSDSKIDVLDVNLAVNVTQMGNYSLNGRLVNSDGLEAGWGSGDFVANAPGLFTVTLVFDGSDIGRSHVDGPYTLTDLTISNLSNGTSMYLENVYTTQPYRFTDFEEGFLSIYLPAVSDGRDPAHLERITGIVTQGGVPVANTPVSLEYYHTQSYTELDTVYTDASGTYEFNQNLPVVHSGEYLFVYWLNMDANPNHLSDWYCFGIDYLEANQVETSCDFDIKNVALSSPSSGAAVTLPSEFTWQLRGVLTDSYEFDLADPDDYYPYFYTSLLGYVNSYTLSSLPSGFSTYTPYIWWIWIWGETGYGVSYYNRTVSFNNTGTLVNNSLPLTISQERLQALTRQRMLDER